MPAPSSPTLTVCASAPRTAGGCCALPTPSPCWWRAARPPIRRASIASRGSSRPRCRPAASACPTNRPPAIIDSLLPVLGGGLGGGKLLSPQWGLPPPNPPRYDGGGDLTMRFFFYGTLLDPDVVALVLGRRLPPAAFMTASLPGHARRRIKGGSYPIVVRDPRGEVPGAVVGGLSARDVARLWAFEGPRYRIAPLKVKVDGCLTTVSVFEP